jgi:hypothetical protein
MRQWLLDQLKKLATRKAEVLLVLAMPAVVSVAEVLQTYLVQFVPKPTEIWALRALEVAALGLLAALVSFFYFRPKLKPVDWGAHQDTKTGAYFCSKCFIEHKRLSPLYLSKDQSQYKCPICPGYRHNPAYIPPPALRPPQPSGPQSWMS